jgi:hypothetical protein
MKYFHLVGVGYVALTVLRLALLWTRLPASGIRAWRGVLASGALASCYLALVSDVPTWVPVTGLVAFFSIDLLASMVEGWRRGGPQP